MKNHMRKFCALLAALVMMASGAALADWTTVFRRRTSTQTT